MSQQVLLHFNISARIRAEFLDHLRLVPQLVSGCTIVDAAGFGAQQHYGSALEKVLGQTHRQLVMIVLAQENVSAVLGHIRQQFTSPDIQYWLTPVLASGRLSEV